ncbi:MAG TPA: hypothetical protein VFN43_00650, partial [Humibacillus sp.]|nr:hypothetical protein [Humibacillus sp.]
MFGHDAIVTHLPTHLLDERPDAGSGLHAPWSPLALTDCDPRRALGYRAVTSGYPRTRDDGIPPSPPAAG